VCRLLGMVSGPPESTPAGFPSSLSLPSWQHCIGAPHALRHQAVTGSVPPGNPPGHEDSWGVGWFDTKGQPSLLRQVGSASGSAYFVFASETASKEACVFLGHLRKASCGAITSDNAHPVRVDPLEGESGDSLLIIHNGTLKGALLQWVCAEGKRHQRPEAHSDSDTVALSGWLGAQIGCVDAEQRLAALAAALKRLLEQATLEGDPTRSYTAINLLIAAPEGLYALRQFSKNPEYYTLSARRLDTGGWVLASEPTDNEPGWEALLPGELVFYGAQDGRMQKVKVA
jgi:predicted glutamine amidotransferase